MAAHTERSEAEKFRDPIEDVYIPQRLVTIKDITSGEKAIKRTRSNHVILIRDCRDCGIAVHMNQRIHKLLMVNCVNVQLQFLDSAVLMSNTVEIADCKGCSLFCDATLIRNLNLTNVSGFKVQLDDDCFPVYEEMTMHWMGECSCNLVDLVHIEDNLDPNTVTLLPTLLKHSFHVPDTNGGAFTTRLADDGIDLIISPLSNPSDRSASALLNEADEVQNDADKNRVEDAVWASMYDEEVRTYEEPGEDLLHKVKVVAEYIRQSKHVVVYTGAGVSTSAKIPDYRGPEGVWTLTKKGITPNKSMSLSQALPTYAHYAITALVKRGFVQYVVSTNLDGLHRRSGLEEHEISELHGNCYREVCGECGREYLRGFDVLLSRADRWSHLTGRKCSCGGDLKDTIVHFTEHMPLKATKLAVENARKADLALVLGTSMNVQPAASYPPKALHNPGGKFVLVNIQKTPYDKEATLKVYARTDDFMKLLMHELGITEFDQTYDHTLELLAKEAAEEQVARGARFIGAAWAAVAIAALAYAYVTSKK